MDRLFLAKLVREVGPSLVGRKVRGVVAENARRGFALRLSGSGPSFIVFHLATDGPGLYLSDVPPGRPRWSEAPPRLGRPLMAAVIEAVEVAPLDRVVDFRLRRRKLSGRETAWRLVVEWAGVRAAAFLVDIEATESGRVHEAFAPGKPRTTPGSRFTPLAPPKGASTLARDAREFQARMEQSENSGLGETARLLQASGFSPRIVREMQHRIQVGALEPVEVFTQIRTRLDASRPWLAARGPDSLGGSGAPCVLSPIELTGEPNVEAVKVGSFNEAARAAGNIASQWRRTEQLRIELTRAVRGRLKKQRSLLSKLRQQRDALVPPEDWRRQGELLLAGLSDAQRKEKDLVSVPDSFGPPGQRVELAIDPRRSLTGNVDRFFESSRKSKRAETKIEDQLAKLERDVEYLEQVQLTLADPADVEELEQLREELVAQKILRRETGSHGKGPSASSSGKPFSPRRFQTHLGKTILAGRSGRSNEQVTFRMAQPADLWFHASGMPGAHVVLRLEGEPADEREVQQAASVAAHFSKGRGDTRVEVLVASCAQVSKIKGAPPGLVRVEASYSVRVVPGLPSES